MFFHLLTLSRALSSFLWLLGIVTILAWTSCLHAIIGLTPNNTSMIINNSILILFFLRTDCWVKMPARWKSGSWTRSGGLRGWRPPNLWRTFCYVTRSQSLPNKWNLTICQATSDIRRQKEKEINFRYKTQWPVKAIIHYTNLAVSEFPAAKLPGNGSKGHSTPGNKGRKRQQFVAGNGMPETATKLPFSATICCRFRQLCCLVWTGLNGFWASSSYLADRP